MGDFNASNKIQSVVVPHCTWRDNTLYLSLSLFGIGIKFFELMLNIPCLETIYKKEGCKFVSKLNNPQKS